jgi:hypothetical protein
MKVYYFEDLCTEDLANSYIQAFTSRRAAVAARQRQIKSGEIALRENAEIREVEFPISRQGIIEAIEWASGAAMK